MKNKKRFIVTLLIITVLTMLCMLCVGQCYTATAELKNVKNEVTTIQNELNTSQKNLQSEIEKNDELSKEFDNTKKKLKTANQTINDLKDSEYELVYMGNFKITHYCTERYAHICGGGQGVTSTGTTVTVGRTIAVDPSVIPYGTQVYIDGYGFRTAEDCGGAVGGKHLDIAVGSHSEAMSLGTVNKSVWMLVKKS